VPTVLKVTVVVAAPELTVSGPQDFVEPEVVSLMVTVPVGLEPVMVAVSFTLQV